MKRSISVLMIMLACLTAFSAGISDYEDVSSSEVKDRRTVIRIWTLDRHDAAFWLDKIAEYNRTNEHGIYVEYDIYTDNYWQAVEMAFQTGDAPDILRYDPALDKYLFQGRFADLLPFMDDEQKELTREGWYDGINYLDGKLYCIFTGSGFARLFFNQTIFNRLGLEPPRTLDELVETARIITEECADENIYGFACNLESAKNGLKRSLEPMVELGEGIRFGYDFGTGTYDFSPYVPYLEAWRELMDYSMPGCESLGIDLLRRQFADGKIGMYMSYAQAEPGVYDFQFPMKDGQLYGCTSLPVHDGIHGRQGGGGTPAYYLNRESADLEKAWLAYSEIFLDYGNLVERFERNLGITNLSKVQEGAVLSDKYMAYPDLLLNREHDTIYPKTPEEKYPQGFILEGLDMFDVFGGIIGGSMELESSIDDLTRRYNEANERLIESGYERIIDPEFSRM